MAKKAKNKQELKEKIMFYVAMIMLYLTITVIVPGDLGLKMNEIGYIVSTIGVVLFGIFMYTIMFRNSKSRQ